MERYVASLPEDLRPYYLGVSVSALPLWRRLEEEAPDYWRRIPEFGSIRKAAIAAGVYDEDRVGQMRNLWNRMTPKEREEFYGQASAYKYDEKLPTKRRGPAIMIAAEGVNETLEELLAHGWGITELAKELGVAVRTVRRWSKAHTQPSEEDVAAMAALTE